MYQSRHCGRCGAGAQVANFPEFVLRLQTRGSSAWPQNNTADEVTCSTIRLVELIHEQCWVSAIPGLICNACGTVPAGAHEQVHESYHWVNTADTFVTSLQRFKTVGFDGKHTTWRKDNREVECPFALQIHEKLYALVAVVGHIGESLHNGHYTAMVRNGADGQWYTCNDDSVMKYGGVTSGAATLVKMADGADPCILFFQAFSIVNKTGSEHNKSLIHDLSKPDSPETQAMAKHMNITPKRKQSFQPDACKICGRNGCTGTCMQCL